MQRDFARLRGHPLLATLLRYGIAVLLSAAAGGVWFIFHRTLQPSPFPLFLLAIVISSISGGLGPGLLTTILGTAVSALYEARVEGTLLAPRAALPLVTFAIAGVFVAYLDARLRRARQQVERARAAEMRARAQKDEILATLAHDIRNPLTAAKGYAYLLRRHAGESERLANEAEQIERAVMRAIGLIRQLEMVFREEDMTGIHDSTINLNELTHEIVDRYRYDERHPVVLQADGEAVVGPWDRDAIGRAIENLLTNAIKYSPDGGEIRVALRHTDGDGKAWAEVMVQDHGLGVPAADLPHVFEGFHRGANVVGRIDGTGLGLAGVRHVVEQCGGNVAAESVEGEGSAFTLRLPLHR